MDPVASFVSSSPHLTGSPAAFLRHSASLCPLLPHQWQLPAKEPVAGALVRSFRDVRVRVHRCGFGEDPCFGLDPAAVHDHRVAGLGDEGGQVSS